MSVSKGFAGGFGGCLGVGCAIMAVIVALPVGCLLIGGLATSVAPDASGRAKKEQQPDRPSPRETPPASVTKRDARPTGLVVSDAAAVYAAFDRNEVQADIDMKDKWFAVKGKIEKIGKDIVNTPYVALGSGEEFSVFCVQCMFTDADEAVLAQLRPGQTVVIAGKCAGKMGNVLMRECWLYDEGARERERARAEAEERHAQEEERKQQEAERKAKIEEAKWRKWTSADGKFTVEAKFIKASGDTVHLEKRDGVVIKIGREKLSDEDWKWITTQGWNTSSK